MAQGLRRAVKPVSRQVGATDQKSRRHKPSPGSQRRLLKCSRPSDVRKLAAKQKPPSPFSESDLGRSENSPQGFLGSVLDGGRSSRGPVPILFCLEVRCATVIAVATVAGTRQHAAAARAAQPLPPARPPARRGPRGARAAARRPGQPARARHAGVRGHRGQHVPCCCSHGGAVAAVASCGVRTCTAKGRDCEFKGTCVALEGTICGFRNKVGLQTDALDNKTRDKGAVDSALEPRRPPLTTPLTVGGRAGGRTRLFHCTIAWGSRPLFSTSLFTQGHNPCPSSSFPPPKVHGHCSNATPVDRIVSTFSKWTPCSVAGRSSEHQPAPPPPAEDDLR